MTFLDSEKLLPNAVYSDIIFIGYNHYEDKISYSYFLLIILERMGTDAATDQLCHSISSITVIVLLRSHNNYS